MPVSRIVKRPWIIFVISTLILAGCGGSGGSSSGNPTSSGENTSAFAGFYRGAASVTGRLAGQSGTGDFSAAITVTPNGQIRFSFENNAEYVGAIYASGNYRVSGSIKRLGLSECRGIITVTGTVAGNQVTGAITSRNIACNLISGSVRGNLTATKQ